VRMKAAKLLIVILLGTASSLSASLIKTTTTLASLPNPSTYGEVATFTAVVTPAPNGSTETVTFMQGKNVLGTEPLSGGSATFTISTLTPGNNTIRAMYNSDGVYGSSTSNAVNQVVDKVPTTTTLASSPNPSNSGQAVTFTANVSAQTGGTITGNVAFYNGSTKLGAESLSGGLATFTTTKLPVGTSSITAIYNGSGFFATSTSTALIQTVNGGSSGCGSGTYIDSSMIWDNITRYYEVYLPTNLSANPPMVLMLHGTRSTESTGDDPTPVITLNWGWPPVADQYCFILVKPASTYDPTTHAWNWNAYSLDTAFPYAQGCGATDCPDDSGFLKQLIINLEAQYNVNPSMVYVAGFSSGAEMTERVGVDLAGLVAAIAPASGQLVAVPGTVPPPIPLPPNPPAYPISVQEWHGTLDQNLWPCGYGQTKYNGFTFTLDTVDDTFNYWSTTPANSCTTLQTTAPLCLNGVPNNANDAATPGLSGLTGNIATGCASNGTNSAEVQFIWEPGVEHSWRTGYDTQRWQFFAAHPCSECGPDAEALRKK